MKNEQARLRIRQVTSPIGTPPRATARCCAGLGLRRIRHVVEREDTPGGARHDRQDSAPRRDRRGGAMKLHDLSPGQGQQAHARSASAAAPARASARPPARARRARSRAPATARGPASRAARCRSSAGCRSAASPTSSRPSTRWSTSAQLGELRRRGRRPEVAGRARPGAHAAGRSRCSATASSARRCTVVGAQVQQIGAREDRGRRRPLRGARFVIESFRNIFAIPDLRKRVLFTFGLLAVYRIGCHIPTPGVDPQRAARVHAVGAEHVPRASSTPSPAAASSGSRCSRSASCRTSPRRSSCSC